MKQRNLMVLTLSCALLIIIELGVSIIYSDYIYNPAKGLISINVASQSYNDPNWEPSMNNPYSSRLASDFMKSVDNWAKESRAAIIYKNAFSSGCGYSDYSGWLISSLGIPAAENKTAGGKEVYTTEGNSFNAAYVNDGILFPGKANLRISGTFNDESLPPALAGCDYFYPLTMSEVTDGVYLTDATEIDSLLKLFDDKGYEILYFTEDVDEFAIKMLMNYKEKEFKSVSSGDLGIESEEENKKENEENKGIFEAMKEALGEKISAVKASSRLKNYPVCLSSEGEVSIEMEKILSAMPNNQGVKAQKVLEVNTNHEVFNSLKDALENDRDKFNLYTKLLYNQALLVEGLSIEDPVDFTNDICKLMK